MLLVAKRLSLFLFILAYFNTSSAGQQVDTLKIFSKAFQTNRTIIVHTPEYFQYQSEQVKLPIYFILDGQHEWLVKPTLSTIEYLVYTKEIPPGIVVEIPLEDRFTECSIPNDGEATLALHHFITEELMEVLDASYPTNGFRVLIGHSMSASFALYSLALEPDFYSAVLAHSPLDELEKLTTWMTLYSIPSDKIYISVGGTHQSKDMHHRAALEKVKSTYPEFFDQIEYYPAEHSAHNAVHLVSNPIFLTKLFEEYSFRFTKIAEVDMYYQLKGIPESIEKELLKIEAFSKFREKKFPLGVADINGIASRYLTNKHYTNHSAALYELGTELYPEYFEFYIYLAEYYMVNDPSRAKISLKKSKLLLNTHESNSEDYDFFKTYINKLLNELN